MAVHYVGEPERKTRVCHRRMDRWQYDPIWEFPKREKVYYGWKYWATVALSTWGMMLVFFLAWYYGG